MKHAQLITIFTLISAFCFGSIHAEQQVSKKDEVFQVKRLALKLCQNETDRLDRLACFDDLFETPLTNVRETNVNPLIETSSDLGYSVYSSIVSSSEKLEVEDIKNWRFSYQLWDEEIYQSFDEYQTTLEATAATSDSFIGDRRNKILSKNLNVFLSTEELLSPDVVETIMPSHLLFACEDNISFLALVTSDQLDERKGEFDLRLENKILSNMDWLRLENRVFLLAPRGMQSIRTISQLFSSNRLQLVMEIDGLSRNHIFDISSLQEMILPMRKACQW